MVHYFVYTDGSCSNNGKSNAKAGIGVYFGDNDSRNVSERINGKQTNNRAELLAILKAGQIIGKDNVTIVSDSEYAIKCVTTYGKKCHDSQWETTIANKELVKEVYYFFQGKSIDFKHVYSHTSKQDIHSLGNEQADKLATKVLGISSVSKKIYLNVPYQKKDHAKSLGAKWDPSKKKWYTENDSSELLTLYKIE